MNKNQILLYTTILLALTVAVMPEATAQATPDTITLDRVFHDGGNVGLDYTITSNGGAPIESLTLFYQLIQDSSPTGPITPIPIDLDATSVTIPNLQDDQFYQIALQGTNSQQQLSTSQAAILSPVDSNGPPQPTVPGTPTLNDVTRSDNNLTFDITPPENDGNSPLIAYDIYAQELVNGQPSGDYAHVGVLPFTETTTGTNLDASKYYRITVAAVNAVNPGEASNALNVDRVPARADIINLTDVDRDRDNLTLHFETPDFNGSPFVRYIVSAAELNENGHRNGNEYGSNINDNPNGRTVTIRSLVDDRSYEITVQVRNNEGTNRPSNVFTIGPVPTAPDAPVLNDVTREGDTLTLHFDVPNDNGSPILDYRVSAQQLDSSGSPSGQRITATMQTDENQVTIEQLQDDKRYQIVVQANNVPGFSLISNTIIVEVVPATAPDAPVLNDVNRQGDTLILDYDIPNDNGAPILGYIVTATELDEDGNPTMTSFTRNISTNETSVTISDLDDETSYRITITAQNGIDRSEASNARDAPGVPAQPQATAPDAPVINDIQRSGDSLTIDYDTPDDGGSPITGYTVNAFEITGPTTTSAIPVSNSMPINSDQVTLDDLADDKRYRVSMVAINDEGSSSPSNTFDIASAPDAPVLNDVTRNGDTLTLDYDVPNDNGAPIHTFLLFAEEIDENGNLVPGGDTHDRPFNTGDTQVTIDDLEDNKRYRITIVAQNDVELSPASNTFDIASRPADIILGDVSRSGTTVTLTFETPADGGSPINRYHIWAYSLDANNQRTGDSIGGFIDNNPDGRDVILPGLDDNISYHITVEARNAIGTNDPSNAELLEAVQPAPVQPSAPTAPGAPRLNDVDREGNTLILEYVAPSDNGGSSLTGYLVTAIELENGIATDNHVTADIDTDDTEVTMPGLDPAKSYRILLQAKNAPAGTGAPSEVRVIPAAEMLQPAPTAPGAPRLNDVDREGNTLILDYTAPENDGGSPITQYYVWAAEVGAPQNEVTTNFAPNQQRATILLLEPDKSYNVQILAENSVDFGERSNSMPVGPAQPAPVSEPDAPVLDAVTRDGHNLILEYTAPYDGGSPLTHYVIHVRIFDDNGNHQDTHSQDIGLAQKQITLDEDYIQSSLIVELEAVNTEFFVSARSDAINAGSEQGRYPPLAQASTEEPPKRGGSDSHKWKTKPTFGVNYNTYQPLVTCGYSMDDTCRDVMEYHVDYKRQIIHTNSTHDFALKVYASNGMKTFGIGFGIEEIGKSVNEAEAQIYVNLIRNYTDPTTYSITDVEVIDENNVIDYNVNGTAISLQKCMETSNNEACVQVDLPDVLFRETMYHDPFVIYAADQTRRTMTHYMNEGLAIEGDSLNPAPTGTAGILKEKSQDKPQQIELVRTDKLADLWEDQWGNIWTKNDHSTWQKITVEKFERHQDGTMSVMTRTHSGYTELVNAEKDRATLLWDNSKLASKGSKSFSIDWSGVNYDQSRMEKLAEKLEMQNEKAQKVMEQIMLKHTTGSSMKVPTYDDTKSLKELLEERLASKEKPFIDNTSSAHIVYKNNMVYVSGIALPTGGDLTLEVHYPNSVSTYDVPMANNGAFDTAFMASERISWAQVMYDGMVIGKFG